MNRLSASHKFFSARILAGDENTVSTPIYYLRSACHRVVQGVVQSRGGGGGAGEAAG